MTEYSQTVETTGDYRARVVLMVDSYDLNPRTDRDGIVAGVVTLTDRRYLDIGDPTGTLADAWDRLSDRYGDRDAVAIFQRYVGILGGVSEYDSPHDGPAAVWYVLPEYMTAPDVGFRPEEVTPEKMRAALDAERTEYRAWAEGDVWGVVIEKRVTWHTDDPDADRDTWEDVESVWGFIGREYAEGEARSMLTAFTKPANA